MNLRAEKAIAAPPGLTQGYLYPNPNPNLNPDPDLSAPQTLMFSATWPTDIQRLASEFLSDPVKVTIGSQDLSASHSVSQARALSLAIMRDCH